MQSKSLKRSALLLLRTPFQAWVAERVMRAENISDYELVYFTQNDSIEDRRYFKTLSSGAIRSQYCFSPIRRFDILGHLDFRLKAESWFRDKGHTVTLLSSIDSFVPNAIACRQSGELVTFDDGTANFNERGAYHVDGLNWRGKIYRHLFGAADLVTMKRRIVRHYTLYPQFSNIVDQVRMRTLDGWSPAVGGESQDSLRTYFLGQPFQEVLSPAQISALESHLKTMAVDFYVRHPRERKLLDIGAPCLDKQGRIAEDAIVSHAGTAAVHLVGWFSTVLFNLGEVAQRRTMLLLNSDPGTPRMAEMARQAGCEVVIL